MGQVITSAVVLAAGFGKRMRPLTDVVPKPLVRLAGRPLLDHVLDGLAAGGIVDAVVNGHYLADQIEQHLVRRNALGAAPRLTFSDERAEILDTGGGVVRATRLLADRPFVVHNSDSVWIESTTCDVRGKRNLDRLVAGFDAERMDCLLLLAPAEGSLGYQGRGDFDLATDGRLVRREPGQSAAFVFAGASIAHRGLLQGAPDGPFSLVTLWNAAIARGRAYGVRLQGLWMHVGDIDALAQAEAAIDRAAGDARPHAGLPERDGR